MEKQDSQLILIKARQLMGLQDFFVLSIDDVVWVPTRSAGKHTEISVVTSSVKLM